MPDNNTYPPVGFHFRVDLKLPGGKGKSEISFQEISGLTKEMTTEEWVEGGENRFVYRFPKGTKYANLVLKRGMKVQSEFIDWVRDAIDHFDIQPADITITLLNEDRDPLVVWEFVKCWPVKWNTTDLKAQENALVIETLELNYHYYTQSNP